MDKLINELFEKWVTQINIDGGISKFFLDSNGMGALEIDQGLIINFQAHSSPPKMVLFTLIGPLPEENRSELMAEMLQANLMWYATNGATLSMRRDENSLLFNVVLAQCVNVHKGTAFTELQRAFDNMCVVALDWKARLENKRCRPERPMGPSTDSVRSLTGLV